MKKLLTLTLLGASLLIAACGGTKLTAEEEALKESVVADASKIAKEAPEEVEAPKILGDWQEFRSKDDYNGEWRDMEREKVISFQKKNVYTEKDKENDPCHGFYSQAGKQLVLEHSCNKVRLTYEVVRMEGDTLTLGIQGRHGQVLYEYLKK